MKYIIKNDILETFNKKKYLILIYFSCLVMISFFFKSDSLKVNTIISDSIIGIDFYNDANILLKLFMLFNYFLYIYIAYYIFIKDTLNSYGNIFSRISRIKWLFSKLVSIMIITFIMKIISCLIVWFIYNNKIEIYSYTYNFIFVYLCQIIALIGYIVATNSRKISILLFLCCLIIIGLLSFDFSMITSKYYNYNALLKVLMICLLIYLISGKKKLGLVLERNG